MCYDSKPTRLMKGGERMGTGLLLNLGLGSSSTRRASLPEKGRCAEGVYGPVRRDGAGVVIFGRDLLFFSGESELVCLRGSKMKKG